MELHGNRGIKGGVWLPNMILRSDDINFINESQYQNLADQASLRSLVTGGVSEVLGGLVLSHDNNMVCTLSAGDAVSSEGTYFNADTWGFFADTDKRFYVVVPEDTSISFDNGNANPRIDVLEIRPVQQTYNQESRQFKDPVTSSVTSALTNTRVEYDFEFQIKKGTPAGSPVAPTKTAGWIKLAEVYVEASATALNNAKIHTMAGSYAWSTNAGITVDDGKLHADYVETIPTTYNAGDYARLFNRLPLDWNGFTVDLTLANGTHTLTSGFDITGYLRKNGVLSIYGASVTVAMGAGAFLTLTDYRNINVSISGLALEEGYISIIGAYDSSRVQISIDIDPKGDSTRSLEIRQVGWVDTSGTDISDSTTSTQTEAGLYDDIIVVKNLHTISGSLPDYHSTLINCAVENSSNLSNGTTDGIRSATSSKYILLDHVQPDIVSLAGAGRLTQSVSGLSRAVGSLLVSTFKATTLFDGDFMSVCYAPSLKRYVATGWVVGSNTMSSLDGKIWTGAATSPGEFRSVCWAEAKTLFVMVGTAASNNVHYSSNGTSWTTLSITDGDWYGVCYSPALGLFVAVGSAATNNLAYSSLGSSAWTVASISNGVMKSVCWSPKLNLFVAVGSGASNNIQYSSNGTSWTPITVADGDLRGVCWSERLGLFVAVGEAASNNIQYSSNGVNWTAITVPNGVFRGVCAAESLGMFLAVGSGATDNTAYSFDGINWNFITSIADGDYAGVCYSEERGQFIIVGEAAAGHIMYTHSLGSLT